jgi:hypothetical protein
MREETNHCGSTHHCEPHCQVATVSFVSVVGSFGWPACDLGRAKEKCP